jgi:protein O-GlcNAc transferase
MEDDLRQAIELQRAGKPDKAAAVLIRAVEQGRKTAQSLYFLGMLLDHLGKPAQGLVYAVEACELAPGNSDMWYSRANLEVKTGAKTQAIEAYQKTLALAPDHLHATVNLALVAQQIADYPLALKYAEKAIDLGPEELKAWLTMIGSLGFMREFEQAQATANEALRRFPGSPEVLHMLGNINFAAGDDDAAYACYQEAVKKAPDNPKFLYSMGDFLAHQNRPHEAIPFHQRILALNPHSTDARHGLAVAHLKAGYPMDAVPHFLEALKGNPEHFDAFEGLLLASLYLDQTDEREIFELHLEWNRRFAENFQILVPDSSLQRYGKLRVGMVSPDFRNHSVGRFVSPILRHYPRDRIELVCYSDIKRPTEGSRRMEQMGANWVHSYSMTDAQLAQKIVDDRIDVLIDLAGHTGFNRLRVFARKPAPIQISWLGYPHTTGLSTVAYRFSDAVADPPGEADQFSTETLMRLEHGFHCFEPPMALPGIQDTPFLKNGFLTFGSFNNQSKLTELTLERWATLLRHFPESRLILKNNQIGKPENRQHWTAVFEALGIRSDRVDMLGYCDRLEDHYAAYHQIDIALDSFPYNGTTTTCEALWMGVPAMTWEGTNQRSRTGMSLLTHAGLQEWIAKNEHDWLAIAQKWMDNPSELNSLRHGLRARMEQSSVGDQEAFAIKFFSIIETLSENGRP